MTHIYLFRVFILLTCIIPFLILMLPLMLVVSILLGDFDDFKLTDIWEIPISVCADWIKFGDF